MAIQEALETSGVCQTHSRFQQRGDNSALALRLPATTGRSVGRSYDLCKRLLNGAVFPCLRLTNGINKGRIYFWGIADLVPGIADLGCLALPRSVAMSLILAILLPLRLSCLFSLLDFPVALLFCPLSNLDPADLPLPIS